MKKKIYILSQADLDFGKDALQDHLDSVSFVDVSGKTAATPKPRKKSPRPGGLCPGCHGSLIDSKCPDCDIPGSR